MEVIIRQPSNNSSFVIVKGGVILIALGSKSSQNKINHWS